MEPVRLAKKPEKESINVTSLILDKVEAWVLSHALLCLIVAICLLMALFFTFLNLMVGVSATESGVVYNGFDKII